MQCWKIILSVFTLPSAFSSHCTPTPQGVSLSILLHLPQWQTASYQVLGLFGSQIGSWVSWSEAGFVNPLFGGMGWKAVSLSVPPAWWQQNPAMYLWWSLGRRNCSVPFPKEMDALPWFRILDLMSVSCPSIRRKRLLLLPFPQKQHHFAWLLWEGRKVL